MSHNIKEEAYDARIQPLVEQIAAIAKEYDISLLIAADAGSDDFDRPIVAATVLLFDDCRPAFIDATNVLFRGYKVVPPPEDEDVNSDDEDSGILL